ncbi:MAG: hypothetical protein P0119_12145 [Nitrospira sp.]|nr:hypothetical protein [Nitrospira sp.]
MKIQLRMIPPSVLRGLAVLSLLVPSLTAASSKDVNQSVVYSSAATEVGASTGKSPSLPSADRSDRKPGPAWKTIGGTVKYINGNVYTVEDFEGNQIQVYVSRETTQLRGSKKVGDRVRAEITRNGFANSIQ